MNDKPRKYSITVYEQRVVKMQYTVEAVSKQEARGKARNGETLTETEIGLVEITNRSIDE